jgi:hypothetical protein
LLFFIGKILYKHEVQKEINAIKNQQLDRDQQAKIAEEKKQRWAAMSAEEKAGYHPSETIGFVKFMGEKQI